MRFFRRLATLVSTRRYVLQRAAGISASLIAAGWFFVPPRPGAASLPNPFTMFFGESRTNSPPRVDSKAEADFFRRISDSGPGQTLAPIAGWGQAPTLSIHEALYPLGLDNAELYCKSSLNFANDYVHDHNASDLTVDEAAAVNLYTQNWSLYATLNGVLRDEDRTKVKVWLPYLKLLMSALEKLRRANGTTRRRRVTWRGVSRDLASSYSKGQTFTEWSVLSTTTRGEVVESFLGRGVSTVFCVEGWSGVNIRELSTFKGEDEVVYAPGTFFRVHIKIEGPMRVIHLRESPYYDYDNQIGEDYGKRIVVGKDHTVWLYQLAAAQGDPNGLCDLAWCYRNGIGVPKDDQEAVRLYRLAAKQGDPNGLCNLAWCYRHGIGVLKDEKEAVKLYQQAADQGDSNGQCHLAWCYGNGIGVQKDEKEAVKLYQQAADQGDPNGQCNLAWCYGHGIGVLKDENMAFGLYQLAADKGSANGQCHLAFCYQYGNGVPKDENMAAVLYQQAADQGDPNGQYNLAYCYRNGIGVPKNETAADRLYQLAAEQGFPNS